MTEKNNSIVLWTKLLFYVYAIYNVLVLLSFYRRVSSQTPTGSDDVFASPKLISVLLCTFIVRVLEIVVIFLSRIKALGLTVRESLCPSIFWKDGFSIKKSILGIVHVSIGLFVLCVLVKIGWVYFFEKCFGIRLVAQDLINSLGKNNFSLLEYFILFVNVCVLTPIREELIFRMVLISFLSLYIKKLWITIAISGFVFAVMHANLSVFPSLFIVGCVLSYCYCKIAKLEMFNTFYGIMFVVGVHSLVNVYNFIGILVSQLSWGLYK